MPNFSVRASVIVKIFAVLIITAFQISTVAAAQNAPPFTLPTLDGDISLEELKGKVVYVDFWASWCVPCRKSFPWMNEIQSKFGDLGFTIVAINLDEERENVDKFLNKYSANFTIALDPKGVSAQAYQIKGMPSLFLIDKNGVIQKTHVGFRNSDKQSLEQAIAKLVKQ